MGPFNGSVMEVTQDLLKKKSFMGWPRSLSSSFASGCVIQLSMSIQDGCLLKWIPWKSKD